MASAALLLCLGAALAQAQSTTPSAPAPSQSQSQTGQQQGNPFPDDSSQTAQPQKPASGQSSSNPASTAPQPKSSSDNPFPGENPNAPIIPVPGGSSGADSGSAAAGSGDDSGGVSRRGDDPDGDPVRSPDSHAHMATDDGFSSSRRGLSGLPSEDDSTAKPGSSARVKTREQTIKEDLEVGSFYMDRKNWKAAQARFTSAFSLDSENPDAIFGLAEAERHLELYKEAAGHYKLFLSYDPDGPHSKAARKGLEEVESASPSVSAASKMANSPNNPR